jgi:hypothetical protein
MGKKEERLDVLFKYINGTFVKKCGSATFIEVRFSNVTSQTWVTVECIENNLKGDSQSRNPFRLVCCLIMAVTTQL